MKKFTTKEAFCQQIGMSKATFYRRLKELGIRLSGKLLSPEDQYVLRRKLGIRPPPEIVKRIETN